MCPGLQVVKNPAGRNQSYTWKQESGLETENTYTGFSAQNVQDVIPEAVSKDKQGYLTLSDRPIIATLVNAVKELKSENKETKAENTELKAELESLKSEVAQLEAALQKLVSTRLPQENAGETATVLNAGQSQRWECQMLKR